MKISINWNSPITLFSLPLLLMTMLAVLTQTTFFQDNPQALSNAITLDLILTLPLFYFLLIRKKDIPKITVASVFILGLVVANWIIPTTHQFVLQQVQLYVFPLVEMGVLGYLAFKTYQTLQHFKLQKNHHTDFYTALTFACKEALPKRIAAILATEIAVVYYTIFGWRKRELAANEFTYFKKSGIRLLMATFIFLIFIETFALHLILQLWSPMLAWVLTAISLYTCLQIVALLKSMTQRPILIDLEGRKLFLRYGFFSETTISLEDIQSIEASTKPLPSDKSILQFSPLGQLDKHNLILHLKSENTLQRMYGLQSSYKSLAIYVDEKEQFAKIIEGN